MKKIILLIVFISPIIKLNAMDPNILSGPRFPQLKKEKTLIDTGKKLEAVTTQDTNDTNDDTLLVKLKALQRRYNRLSKKYKEQADQIKELQASFKYLLRNQTISHDNKAILDKKLKAVGDKLKPTRLSLLYPDGLPSGYCSSNYR